MYKDCIRVSRVDNFTLTLKVMRNKIISFIKQDSARRITLRVFPVPSEGRMQQTHKPDKLYYLGWDVVARMLNEGTGILVADRDRQFKKDRQGSSSVLRQHISIHVTAAIS